MLRSGYFPAVWKKAQITPVNKVRSPKLYKDMRPIALTFHLAKISEKIIAHHIKQELPHLDNQYAYTRGLSTTDALVRFSTDITSNLDNKDTISVRSLLVDFSKAFDRMRPDLAVSKLLSLNIDRQLVKICMSFLSDRKQQVKVQDSISQLRSSKIGVPQGTILGPLLWNVFVSDLSPLIKHIKYADDTTLYHTVSKDNSTISESTARHVKVTLHNDPLQNAASYTAEWCSENMMILNACKSHTISFSLKKCVETESIIINNLPILDLNEVKLLGVTYDSHMKFTAHVDNVISKSKPAFHAIVRLRKAGISAQNLALFYKARIVSILTYSAPSWYPYITNNDKQKLEQYQRLCLKVILPHIENYDEQLGKLGLSEINTELDMSCLRYVEKVKSPNHPLNHYLPEAPNHLHHKSRATIKRRTALMDKNLFIKYK